MPSTESKDKQLCSQLECWVENVVIKHNFCPFAKREHVKKTIRYTVSHALDIEECLHALIDECLFLDSHKDTETTLIIFADAVTVFDDFLDLVEMAEILLVEQAYDDTYQLANFHPDYVFSDSHEDDPANYTNRTPLPVLHLLRSASMENALNTYQHPERIPDNNIKLSRQLGLDYMKKQLASCKKI